MPLYIAYSLCPRHLRKQAEDIGGSFHLDWLLPPKAGRCTIYSRNTLPVTKAMLYDGKDVAVANRLNYLLSTNAAPRIRDKSGCLDKEEKEVEDRGWPGCIGILFKSGGGLADRMIDRSIDN
jgi:hypothetical protein